MTRRILYASILLAALAFCFAGCGKSGTKPPSGPPATGLGSTGSTAAVAPASSSGAMTPAELGARSLIGANPAPVVDANITDGGAVTMCYSAEPDTLNPLTSTDAYSSAILERITDSLADRNPDTLELEPALAESWEVSEDHLTYTFHLRKDVAWQDGKPFTAADVTYSFDKIKDPSIDTAQLRNYFNDLESVTAADDYTVLFKWSKPYWLSFESSVTMPVIPRHVWDVPGNFNLNPAGRAPVGNGMFRFVEWKTGDRIVLERNNSYYGRKPHIKRLVIRFIVDDNAALQQASSGLIDTMGVTSEQWVSQIPKDVFSERFNKFYAYGNNFGYIGWNTRTPCFSDKRVRRAMTHLVNREAILQNILYGLGKIVTCSFYMYSKSYSPDIKPWPYDPAEAVRLLNEAGWVDHDGDGIRDKTIDGQNVPFSFTFAYTSGSRNAERIAVLLQEELRKVGITMNIQNLEWAVFLQRVQAGQFDATTLGWHNDSVNDDPYQIWHSSQIKEGSNYIGYSNPEVDSLLVEARTEFDPDRRNALYHRFNEILHDEQPYTFLFCTPGLSIADKRIHNVVVHKMRLDLRDWYIPADLQDK